jgi:hypothetical protein
MFNYFLEMITNCIHYVILFAAAKDLNGWLTFDLGIFLLSVDLSNIANVDTWVYLL